MDRDPRRLTRFQNSNSEWVTDNTATTKENHEACKRCRGGFHPPDFDSFVVVYCITCVAFSAKLQSRTLSSGIGPLSLSSAWA